MYSKEIEHRLIYEYIRGSHCHGISTPSSDIDMGGVFVTPIENLVSLRPESDTYEDGTHDCVAYELGKYCRLLLKANPTMLESLFVDSNFIVKQHPAFYMLKDMRDSFVTQDCFNSFTGYAYSQISKARGLNKKICNPVEKRLTPMDFCYTFHNGGSIPMAEFLKRNNYEQERCGLVAIEHMHDTYAVYYCDDAVNVFRGVVSPEGDEVRLTSVPKGMKPICYMTYNKSGYSLHCKEYKEYQDWVKKRNPVRYESNLNKNYDCYLDKETEFLTANGWKHYDEIDEYDLIATFDDTHTIKFEPYISRYDSIYSGEMWTLETSYIKCTVTPNHKLYMSHSFVNKKTDYKYRYLPNENVWEHITVNDFLNNRKGEYFILNHLNNDKMDNPDIDDEMLSIIGLFLSDGTTMYKNGKISCIRISQLKTGKAYNTLHEISDKYKCGEYHFIKRKNRDEVSFDFKNEKLFELVQQCITEGKYSYQKVMPLFAYTLSKRQFDIMFKSMMLGDGYYHKNGNLIYYTSSKELAIGLHTLLSINGYNAQMYGKENTSYQKRYDKTFPNKDNRMTVMYQVFVSKNDIQYKRIGRTMSNQYGRKKCGFTQKYVSNERIVCFEMKYGTLVTRNDNKMSYHCNSKNMCECFRLLRMGIEIARGEGVIVNRSGRDADFLLDVKAHKYEYDELMKMLESEFAEMKKYMETTKLPKHADEKLVSDTLSRMRGAIRMIGNDIIF